MTFDKYNADFKRQVDKSEIPVCNIMGVDIAAINMDKLVEYIRKNIKHLSGDYITVANVHTTVTAFEDPEYMKVQNGGIMSIPDGGPLSAVGKKRGYEEMSRTTGPDLMGEIFKISAQEGYKHFFYGSTNETLAQLKKKLKEKYPDLNIIGMYSPPFGKMSKEEHEKAIDMINSADADFVWVGLGAPKQEKWMAEHQGKLRGLMIGVGAGFDYHAENIKRAPMWMQKANLEWFFRLMQEPKRLFGRYWHTNWKFIWYAFIRKE
jgi:N-acetylglucosaminyldiphosphoundecaprenol N-acetyl-beta-D-mannosaminyltransferase